MATAKSLWKLHSTGAQPPEPGPVKTENFSDLKIDVSAPAPAPMPVRERRRRAGFRIGPREEREAQGYSLMQPEVMAILTESAPPGGDRFAELRMRERLSELVRAGRFRSGGRGGPGWAAGPAIQI